jgi:hypothetical protein
MRINQLCNEIHKDIKKISSENWYRFIASIGQDHLSTRRIWKKIEDTKNPKSCDK